MITRFDPVARQQVIEQPSINTYVPLPFDDLAEAYKYVNDPLEEQVDGLNQQIAGAKSTVSRTVDADNRVKFENAYNAGLQEIIDKNTKDGSVNLAEGTALRDIVSYNQKWLSDPYGQALKATTAKAQTYQTNRAAMLASGKQIIETDTRILNEALNKDNLQVWENWASAPEEMLDYNKASEEYFNNIQEDKLGDSDASIWRGKNLEVKDVLAQNYNNMSRQLRGVFTGQAYYEEYVDENGKPAQRLVTPEEQKQRSLTTGFNILTEYILNDAAGKQQYRLNIQEGMRKAIPNFEYWMYEEDKKKLAQGTMTEKEFTDKYKHAEEHAMKMAYDTLSRAAAERLKITKESSTNLENGPGTSGPNGTPLPKVAEAYTQNAGINGGTVSTEDVAAITGNSVSEAAGKKGISINPDIAVYYSGATVGALFPNAKDGDFNSWMDKLASAQKVQQIKTSNTDLIANLNNLWNTDGGAIEGTEAVRSELQSIYGGYSYDEMVKAAIEDFGPDTMIAVSLVEDMVGNAMKQAKGDSELASKLVKEQAAANPTLAKYLKDSGVNIDNYKGSNTFGVEYNVWDEVTDGTNVPAKGKEFTQKYEKNLEMANLRRLGLYKETKDADGNTVYISGESVYKTRGEAIEHGKKEIARIQKDGEEADKAIRTYLDNDEEAVGAWSVINDEDGAFRNLMLTSGDNTFVPSKLTGTASNVGIESVFDPKTGGWKVVQKFYGQNYVSAHSIPGIKISESAEGTTSLAMGSGVYMNIDENWLKTNFKDEKSRNKYREDLAKAINALGVVAKNPKLQAASGIKFSVGDGKETSTVKDGETKSKTIGKKEVYIVYDMSLQDEVVGTQDGVAVPRTAEHANKAYNYHNGDGTTPGYGQEYKDLKNKNFQDGKVKGWIDGLTMYTDFLNYTTFTIGTNKYSKDQMYNKVQSIGDSFGIKDTARIDAAKVAADKAYAEAKSKKLSGKAAAEYVSNAVARAYGYRNATELQDELGQHKAGNKKK